MKLIRILSAFLLIYFCSSNLDADMYSWTDENGVKHYSNTIPPQDAEVIEEFQGSKSGETTDRKQSREVRQGSRNQAEVKQGSQNRVNDSIDKSMALRVAANTGHLEEVERLLSEGADINASASNGMTPLILASWRGHTKVVALLLRKGADVNAKTNNGTTALMFATERGHKEVIALLRKHGA